ncbi:MAG: AMP-binding protein [Alphaproteobacteria bacterium]
MQQYFDALEKDAANYVPLSPLSFLARAQQTYGNKPCIAYQGQRQTWREFGDDCRKLADGFIKIGAKRGDVISVIAPNIPSLFALHYAIPMAGAVIGAINTRLEDATIAYILDHSDCAFLCVDAAYIPLVQRALALLSTKPKLIVIHDIYDEASNQAMKEHSDFGDYMLDEVIAKGDPEFDITLPADEWDALALNYTSGTSGRPKGVVYHHRGAYLMSMGSVAAWALPQNPHYLSIVPMFHCNGWNHPWAMAIVGAKMVFTRDPAPKKIFKAIADEGVTHFGAAPIILSMLCESEFAPQMRYDPLIKVLTAGAPPPPAILQRANQLGLEVMQVYGLTETYGHISQCIWQAEWNELDPDQQAQKQAMQGVAFPMMENIRVINRETGKDVALHSHDQTAPEHPPEQGEIAIRGNCVMKGYYKDPDATQKAFDGGYFWSGDAAVMDDHYYIHIRDRLKDVIISGGENISSVEIEAALHAHDCVQLAAVVAIPSKKWGESPCAFIELKAGHQASEQQIIAFCETRLARFKLPKKIIFDEIPKTSTGKVQKFQLRERIKILKIEA